MQYCDSNNQCSPNCGMEGEPCCLISFGECPVCQGDLLCMAYDRQRTDTPDTRCVARSLCGADDAGTCTTCGADDLPCCGDAGCALSQAAFCAGEACFTPPPMR